MVFCMTPRAVSVYVATKCRIVASRQVVAEDSKDIEEGVTVLLDREGHIVGLELLDASERLGKEQLHSVTLKDLAFELSLSKD